MLKQGGHPLDWRGRRDGVGVRTGVFLPCLSSLPCRPDSRDKNQVIFFLGGSTLERVLAFAGDIFRTGPLALRISVIAHGGQALASMDPDGV